MITLDSSHLSKVMQLLDEFVEQCAPSPLFSDELRSTLVEQLGLYKSSIRRLEAQCQLVDYADKAAHNRMRREVHRRLRRSGCAPRAGKRFAANLETFVEDLIPLLQLAMVPIKAGENSRAVNILRAIARDIGVEGDPRGKLRRLVENSPR